MDLAAEVVQDIARYFKLEELESEADFPAELRVFEEVSVLELLLVLVWSARGELVVLDRVVVNRW